ncbi:RlpA-like double-psi beta-barrel domain-containing protein [Neolewinella persica]|uniref:RlpA-like double-psi beta-barrel domain-containing protein n=1 Tax=Neolewinella persica TaxID=70998 RepID=UPI00035EA349|nr:RlpA-like double-psi beta-barrel domain-containing protein [Neolewinella persica]
MKYLLTLIACCAFTIIQAQQFEWNTKSVEAHPKEVVTKTPAQVAYDKAFNERQTGLAGIYNPNAQGARTAFGEIYNNSFLTASHPILPLGTIVKVQNLDNGRQASVRINDRGQECANCLLMLSQAAANQLGLNYRGRVSVERTGFSNWNPSPAATQPQSYANVPAYGGQVTRPVEINRANQWQSRGGTTTNTPATQRNQTPLAYGNQVVTPSTGYNSPQVYGTPSQQAAVSGNYAVLNAPGATSVMSREVQPATVSREPTTYSRYPTATTPTLQANTQPRSYQPAPRAAGSQTQYYQQPAPVQQQPSPVQQATPPPSTVLRYQESRTVPAPATYATPQPYNPPSDMTARGVATPTPAATTPAATQSGYVVQLGAYNNELYAINRVSQLKQMGLSNVFYRGFQKPDGQFINRVYAGTFPTMADAQQASKLIQGNYQIAGIVSALK